MHPLYLSLLSFFVLYRTTVSSSSTTSLRSSFPSVNAANGKPTTESFVSSSPSSSLSPTVSAPSDYFGVDVSTPVTPDDANCFRTKDNITFAVARTWHSYGAYDKNVVGTSVAFRSANISFDVYMFPCSFAIPPLQQIANLIGNLTRDNVQYNRIWFDIETNTSPGCQWSLTNLVTNCQFFTSLVQTAATNFPNVKFGVYSSMHMWTTILSSDPNGCAVANHLPLWYPHYQSPPQPNFQDFESFGGWDTPTCKQYGNTNSECSVGVDNNWRPTPPP